MSTCVYLLMCIASHQAHSIMGSQPGESCINHLKAHLLYIHTLRSSSLILLLKWLKHELNIVESYRSISGFTGGHFKGSSVSDYTKPATREGAPVQNVQLYNGNSKRRLEQCGACLLMRNLELTALLRLSGLSHTSFIHQRVIIRRPYAFNRSSPQRPIKIIRPRALPATATALKGAGSATIPFISAIATVICEVAALPRSETPAVFTRQEAWRTGAWKIRHTH